MHPKPIAEGGDQCRLIGMAPCGQTVRTDTTLDQMPMKEPHSKAGVVTALSAI
jgi:hypothetical protein